MIIQRVFEQPNKETFKIPSVKSILKRYVKTGKGWIDPFAGRNSPAEITNDLNPEMPTQYHLHAKEFATIIEGEFAGVLFDPPYSLRQAKECYNSFGISLFIDDSQRFPWNVKNILAKKIKLNGYAISFGWNSSGFAKKNGFRTIEILLITHGGKHNDTIVTIDKKIYVQHELIDF